MYISDLPKVSFNQKMALHKVVAIGSTNACEVLDDFLEFLFLMNKNSGDVMDNRKMLFWGLRVVYD